MSGLSEKIKQVIKSAKEKGLSRLTEKRGKTIITVEINQTLLPANKPLKVFYPKESISSNFVGTLRAILKKGAKVKKGDIVAMVVAMHIPNEIISPVAGVVSKVFISKKNKRRNAVEIFDEFIKGDPPSEEWLKNEARWKEGYLSNGIVVQYGDPLLEIKYKKKDLRNENE